MWNWVQRDLILFRVDSLSLLWKSGSDLQEKILQPAKR